MCFWGAWSLLPGLVRGHGFRGRPKSMQFLIIGAGRIPLARATVIPYFPNIPILFPIPMPECPPGPQSGTQPQP